MLSILSLSSGIYSVWMIEYRIETRERATAGPSHKIGILWYWQWYHREIKLGQFPCRRMKQNCSALSRGKARFMYAYCFIFHGQHNAIDLSCLVFAAFHIFSWHLDPYYNGVSWYNSCNWGCDLLWCLGSRSWSEFLISRYVLGPKKAQTRKHSAM